MKKQPARVAWNVGRTPAEQCAGFDPGGFSPAVVEARRNFVRNAHKRGHAMSAADRMREESRATNDRMRAEMKAKLEAEARAAAERGRLLARAWAIIGVRS